MTVDTPIGRARTGRPIDELTINTIRTLSMDAVQAANSGHPGTPMALAPWRTRCGSTTCALIRTFRCGRTGTASCCRSGTRRRADPASFPARSGRLHHGRLFQQILN
jgi:hypothetical protein